MKLAKFLRKKINGLDWVRGIDQYGKPLPEAYGTVSIELYLTHAEYEKLQKELFK